MYYICQHLAGRQKELDFDVPYKNYISNKMFKPLTKYTMIHIRIFEGLKRFYEIPQISMRLTNSDNVVPFLTPLTFEKASYFYLYEDNNFLHKKFCFFQYLAALNYLNMTKNNLDFNHYALNALYLISGLFNKKDESFSKIKEHICTTIGDITQSYQYFTTSSNFYAICLYLAISKKYSENSQIDCIKKFLNSVRNEENMNSQKDKSMDKPSDIIVKSKRFLIKDLSFPEILNSTLITFGEQDIALLKYKGWQQFKQFLNPDRGYINISDSDFMILKNLDSLADNKLFKTSKREFNSNINSKIYVKLVINNPLLIPLNITKINLLSQYKDSNKENEDVELEEISLKLNPKSSNTICLYLIPKRIGSLNLIGLDITLFDTASFKSFFFDVDKRFENMLYEDKLYNKEKYDLIEYKISEEDNQISIQFLNDNTELYQYEFGTIKAKILNKSNKEIKKFSVLFDNNDVFISNYIHYDITLLKNEETLIELPICPKSFGKFKLKVVFKFEEKLRFYEMEIKRYIVSIEVFPLLKREFNEILVYTEKYKNCYSITNKFYFKNDFKEVSSQTGKFAYSIEEIRNSKFYLSKEYSNSLYINTGNNNNFYNLDNNSSNSSSIYLNETNCSINTSNDYEIYPSWDIIPYFEGKDKNFTQMFSKFDIFRKNIIETEEMKFNRKKVKNMNFNSSFNDKVEFMNDFLNVSMSEIQNIFENKISTDNDQNNILNNNSNFKKINNLDKIHESFKIAFNSKCIFHSFDILLKLKKTDNNNSEQDKSIDENYSKIIHCGYIHELNCNKTVNSFDKTKKIIQKKISFSFKNEYIKDNLVINIDFKIQNFFNSLDIKEFDMILKEDNSDLNISWIGTSKRKFCSNDYIDKDIEIRFTCVLKPTIYKSLKFIDLNKFSFNLYSNNSSNLMSVVNPLPLNIIAKI